MTTLNPLLRDYHRAVLVHQRSGEATARSLALLIEPFDRVPIHAITQEHIVRRLDELAQTAPVHAKRMLSYVRSFLDWAVREGVIVENPAWGIAPGAQDHVRGRQLTLREVLRIWCAADALSPRLAGAVRLLILTAAPRQQVGALQLSELERDRRQGGWVWQPTARLLRGDSSSILLPRLAREIVEAAVVGRCAGGEFILSRTGRAPLDGWSKAKRELDQELARRARPDQLEQWWLHDLRTSFPALAVEHAGVDPMVAEVCLGRLSRITAPRAKLWAQSGLMAEQASEALAAWDRVLARKLKIAKRRS